MLRAILKLLNKPGAAPGEPSGERCTPDLSSIPGSIVTDGFPRPQWKIIRTWIDGNVTPGNRAPAWNEMAADWLKVLKEHLGGGYTVSQSRHFYLLSSCDRDTRIMIFQTCELTIQMLEESLGTAVQHEWMGRHVILLFESIGKYYEYIAFFHPPDEVSPQSAGVFLSGGGYMHIALPASRNQRNTLIHEVTHNRLAHLPLPLWLNEGIAITMAKRIGRMVKRRFGQEEYQRHSGYWTQETIAGFWNGSSFKVPENDLSQLCYSLAGILTSLLMQEFPGFKDFVLHADKKDAGEGAAMEYLGISLGDAAATFLGPGKWI